MSVSSRLVSSIYTFTVYPPRGPEGTYLKLIEIGGVIFTLIGFIYVVYFINQKGKAAFKDLWFDLDFLAVILALGTISMFA